MRLVRRIGTTLALLGGALLPPALSADGGMHVIELQYRPAESVIAPVRTLSGFDGPLVADGYRLLVRADDATLDDIRSAVQALDVATAQLRITIRSGTPTELRRHGIGLDAEGVRIHGTRDRHSRDSQQMVTTRTGEPVRIRSGEQVPVTDRILLLGGDHPGYGESRRYVPVERGFYARPEVHGDRVTVDIAASRGAFRSDGSRRDASIDTRLTGALGEWIRVGATGQVDREARDAITYSTRRRQSEGTEWWMRVERLD